MSLVKFVFFFGLAALGSQPIPLITLDGPIGPAQSQYAVKAFQSARYSSPAFFILELHSSQGLPVSTRMIVKAILECPFPVVLFLNTKEAPSPEVEKLIQASDVSIGTSSSRYDLLAESLEELIPKLSRYPLKKVKGPFTTLPSGELIPVSKSLLFQFQSFFLRADILFLAFAVISAVFYLQLSVAKTFRLTLFGIALSLPLGFAFPLLPINYGALLLLALGAVLFHIELWVSTYGMVAFGGLACFVIGAIYLVDTSLPEFQVSRALILPVAGGLALMNVYLGIKLRKRNRTLFSRTA